MYQVLHVLIGVLKMSLFSSTLFLFCFFCFLVFISGIESPQFTVIHSQSDLEIRLYRETSWISAPVREVSFEKATKAGFHRIYQYIHGSNANSSRLTKTSPVLTTFDGHGSQYSVKFYISAKFQGAPPNPYPELNLQLTKMGKHCVAVRKFSGFAKNNTVNKEVEALVTDLSEVDDQMRSLVKYGYSIAQYNASFHLTERLNEVWMNVTGFTREGC